MAGLNSNEKLKNRLRVAELSKKKSALLYNFYENIKVGGEIFSAEDIDIAMEALKLAQLDIKEREARERREKEAELLKQKMEEEEKRRRAAEARAARRAERKRLEHVKQVTAMDLPMDFNNAFDEDIRANIHCDTIAEGLLVCMDALGMVDIEFISAITGEEMKTVIETLKGSIFQNPLHWNECFYKGWETADEYLSGNLMHKYALALEANEAYNGYFNSNINALEELIGPDLSTDEIYITLGSPWVPADVIDDFILHMIGLDPVNGVYPKDAEQFLTDEYRVRHDETTGLWDIPQKTRFRKSHQHGKYEHVSFKVYGTQRMEMLRLLENILNMKTLAVFDTVDPHSKVRIINQPETVKVLEKQNKMIAEFQNWVWADPDRKRRLQGAYCRKYGNIRRRVFDGSFLDFPDMNPEIQLHPHQKNSVARILFTPNTLLAHDVGAGKTFTMIAAGMELRRLGKSRKNLYVIPNNIMAQWVQMFNKMYPQAKLLVVDRRNFCIKKRDDTLRKIMDEDFDAILMTYSCFDMLSLSKKYYKNLYNEQLKRLDKAVSNFATRRAIDAKRLSVIKTLEKIQDDMADNVCVVAFDDLGINTLFVDEAHNYKNVSLHTGISRVRGLSNTGSRKCDAMMDKVHCVQRQNNGGRVILATGTPVTNSITDIFVLQKFLQDGELEFLNIHNFDSWVAMFGKKTTEFEIDVDTNSYHLATRFSRFGNVPELTAILSSIADFYHVDQVMGLPDFNGYTDSTQPGSDDFKVFLQDISRRADDVRQKRVDPHVDNLLKITTDGRKAALDMRLIDMVYGLDPDAKVYRCAEKIMEIYEQTKDTKAIQMVFCDISTPKSGFNLYDELKVLLKAMGMPEHEIAYIHEAQSEAQKNLLFRDLQKGLKRVVIGSTFKMGLGVNVQERLIALHHLDVPWRPADMVQREGRILRQGNTCDRVQIYRYITKGSFDAYSWQLLETKQRFISQILSGHVVEREGEDVDEAVLNYAEVKALAVGNPKIKRRVEVMNELDKYRLLHQDFIDQQHNKKMRLKELPGLIEKQKLRIANTQIDMDYVVATPNTYADMEYEEQKAIRDAIYTAVKTHVNHPLEKKVLTFRGFDVVIPAHMQPKVPKPKYDDNGNEIPVNKEPIPYMFVKRTGAYYMEVESSAGITKRLNNLIDGLAATRKHQEDYLQILENEQASLLQDLAKKEDSYALQIETLKAELDQLNEELGVNVA